MDKSQEIPDLKSIRNIRGWSQEYTAKTVGISRSHYAMIELLKSQPGVKTAQRLGDCFDFDWQVYFQKTGRVKP